MALGAKMPNDETDPDGGDDEDDSDEERKGEFTLSIRMLKKFNYDLSNRMGTVLRPKWRFAKREQAKAAYIAVFGKEEPILNKFFDSQDHKWLSGLRNCLVHDGLFAGARFVIRFKKHPTLKSVKEGDPISIDGKLVKDILTAASLLGLDLLKFVDGYLSKHPD